MSRWSQRGKRQSRFGGVGNVRPIVRSGLENRDLLRQIWEIGFAVANAILSLFICFGLIGVVLAGPLSLFGVQLGLWPWLGLALALYLSAMTWIWFKPYRKRRAREKHHFERYGTTKEQLAQHDSELRQYLKDNPFPPEGWWRH